MFDSFEEDYSTVNDNQEYEDDNDGSNNFSHINEYVNNSYNRIVNQPVHVLNNGAGRSRNEGSLKTKLLELYLEENTSSNFSLNYSTHLLQKLVEREQFNTLVLNLYSIEKGYSLGFNIKAEEQRFVTNFNLVETKLLSYDETELLFFINNGEIPPVVIDLVDRLNVNMFEDGCIIMEIRDYRRRCASQFDLHFILLQPSMQTLVADLNSITNDGNFIWTQEDKYTLESQLILATAQPLCLHPSPIVSILKQKILNHKRKLNDRKLKRNVFKFTDTYLNRAARCNEYDLPLPFHIRKIRNKYSKTNEYLHFQTNNSNNQITSKQSAQISTTSPSSLLITSFDFQSVDNWAKNKPSFELPRDDMILVKKFAKNFENPKYSNDQTLIPMEEIVLKAVDKNSKNNYSKLLIKRRSLDDIYFCQLSLCIDQSNDVLFELGFASEAEKYIQQYIKIFTEEGRRPVSITKKNMFPSSAGQTVHSLFKEFTPTPTTTFQSYFTKKAQNDFNDKQLQTYQNFLFQQQQQQQTLQNQKKQMQNQKMQQHMHVQKQLQNQIKRIKSTHEDQQTTTDNLKNLIQNTENQAKISSNSNLTRICSNKSYQSKSKLKTDSNKCEVSTISENAQSLKVKEETKSKLSTASKLYFPKIASPSLTKSINQTTPITTTTNKSQKLTQTITTGNSSASQTQPTKKTYTKKRANSSSNVITNKTVSLKDVNDSKAVENKKKKTASDTLNISTTISSTKSMPFSNTKIINASNINLFRKIAIDSRSMPVIVTLNSSDPNDVTINHQQQSMQNQFKLKSQQQNKQIKFINSRVSLKPAITNSTNDNQIDNTQVTESVSTTSPIKTFHLQKPNTKILKQLSFPYVHNIKPNLIHSTNSSNILSTVPINQSSLPSTNDSSNQKTDFSPIDITSTSKFLVTSNAQKSTQISTIKPSLVINKKSEQKEPSE